MNLNDATQLLVEPLPGNLGVYDRIAAYRLRSAAFERHLIRDRFEQMYRTPVSAVKAKAIATPAPRAFAPGDHPLHYRTAGIRELVTDVTKFVSEIAGETFDLWSQSQSARATSKYWR